MFLANNTNLIQYLVFYFNFFRAMMNSQRKRLVVIFMKLAVFCGVCYGKEAKYKELAERIGEYIADKGLDLVSGGSISGLMGAVSNGVINKHGNVTGICSRGFFDDDLSRKEINEFIFTETMDEKKQLLINKSDAYLILPGGLETLEELFHLLSSIAIGLVPPKPIAILDIDGYYQSLIEFLIKASNEDFNDYQAIKHILISDDYQSLINKVCIELSEMGVVA